MWSVETPSLRRHRHHARHSRYSVPPLVPGLSMGVTGQQITFCGHRYAAYCEALGLKITVTYRDTRLDLLIKFPHIVQSVPLQRVHPSCALLRTVCEKVSNKFTTATLQQQTTLK
jgi:hypothetical protein